MFASVDSGFILFMLALALAAVIVFLIRIGMRKILHPVRKQKVQVAAIEYQDQNLNAKARKLASNPMGGNRSALQVSHLLILQITSQPALVLQTRISALQTSSLTA